MAMLQSIRNKAIFLALVIGIALFAFIIGDFLNSGSSLFRQKQEEIAEIGGNTLNYKAYESRIKQMEEVYKIQTGKSSLDSKTTYQIRESVFESIIRENILDEQAAKLGINVTPKELFSMINGNNVPQMIQQLPVFRNPKTGAFDRNVMMNFLKAIETDDISNQSAQVQAQIRQYKDYWMFWENNLKYTRIQEKINQLLTRTVAANNLDAESMFNEKLENINFDYAFKSYVSYNDSTLKASRSEIEDLYDSKKEAFKQEPYRSAKYVLVNVIPSAEDSLNTLKNIKDLEAGLKKTDRVKSFVNANSDVRFNDCFFANTSFSGVLADFLKNAKVGEIMPPVLENGSYMTAKLIDQTLAADSVEAYQVGFSSNDKKKADSLFVVLSKKNADFGEIVTKNVPSQASSYKMGKFTEVDALPVGSEFVKKCFSTPKNGLFKFSDKNGIRIVKIVDKSKKVNKSKLAVVSLELTPSSKSYGIEYNKLNKYVAENVAADDFFDEVSKAGYKVQEAKFVRKNDEGIGNVSEMREAVRFIYKNDENSVSSILENNENQFIVVGVTRIDESKYKSLESVTNQLVNEVVNDKKASAIIKQVEGKNVSQAAKTFKGDVKSAKLVNFSMNSINNIGSEPALLAAVNTKDNGVVKGARGVYVYKVTSKKKTEAKFDLKSELSSWNNGILYRVNYNSYEAVKNMYDIVDNRIRFY